MPSAEDPYEEMPAAEALRLGERFGVIPVPLTVTRTSANGHDPNKRIRPLAKYAHLDGASFSLELWGELWESRKDAPGLGIRAPWLVQLEADSPQAEERLRGMGFPRTWRYRSPGGSKWLFRSEEPVPAYAEGGLEVKPATTLHVVPPTPGYEWLPACSPWDTVLAPLPAKVRALRPRRAARRAEPIPAVLPEGSRRGHLLSLAGAMRRKGASQEEILAALRAANEHRCRPLLPDAEVAVMAGDVAERYEPAEPPAVARSLGEVLDVFRERLYVPDPALLYVPLAAYVAHRRPGDPVWLFLVGAPSGGKTETLGALSGQPDVHRLSSLTAATFASGHKDKSGRAASLLERLGESGRSFLVLKDFGTVLSLHRDDRGAVLAQLREIYDGSFVKEFGTGETVDWSGRLGFVAGCTPTIDRHHGVISVLGERFLYLRLAAEDRTDYIVAALKRDGRTAEMRHALREAVAGYLAGLDASARAALSAETLFRLGALADFVTRARSAVERDSFMSREIEEVPVPEMPMRFVLELRCLAEALVVMGFGEHGAWELVRRVGLDSMPPRRLKVLGALRDGLSTAKEIAERVDLPTTTARRVLEDLAALRSAQREGKAGGADQWSLRPEALRLWEAFE